MVKMRFSTRMVSLAFVGMAVFAPLAQAAFTDVSGGEFAQYINDLSTRGIIASNGNFYPSLNLSRGELAKVLVNAAGLTINTSGGQRFSDVPTSNTFFDYIATLANRGTINGYSDNTFRPTGNVSRGEFAKMVAGSFGFEINTSDGPHFAVDVPLGSTFYTFVETLYNRNVVNGYTGTLRFGVNDPVSREQMAKIVSLSLQSKAGTLAPRVSSAVTIERDVPLTFTPALPRLTVVPSSNKVELRPARFPYLPTGYMYNLWVVDATSTHSAGQFNVRNNSITDARGVGMSPNFNLSMSWGGIRSLFVTIESTSTTVTAPSNTLIVRGNVVGSGEFDIDFPTGILGSTARGYITKGASGVANVLNIDIPTAPDLRPVGWSYQVWYTIAGQAQTAGTFTANGNRVMFKSSELPADLMTATDVSVSIVPSKTITTSDTNIILWSGKTGVVSTVTGTTAPTSTPQDATLYKGLTSSLTSVSIRARTVTKSDTDTIIQAYVASPTLADGEEQVVVIKVSDKDGAPISDLNFTLSRVDGPSARFGNPQEIGESTGVYLGTYRTDTTVNTSDTATIRIVGTSRSSSSVAAMTTPSLDLSFDVSASERIGSPRSIEVDIPMVKLVIDENDSDSSNREMVVLITVLDSTGRTVRSVLSSGISLTSNNAGSVTGTVKNNLKYYRLDDRFFDIDDEDNDITVNRNLVIQLVPTSGSDSFSPIISDQYRVQAQFIADND